MATKIYSFSESFENQLTEKEFLAELNKLEAGTEVVIYTHYDTKELYKECVAFLITYLKGRDSALIKERLNDLALGKTYSVIPNKYNLIVPGVAARLLVEGF